MNVYACHLMEWFKQNRDEEHAGPMKKYMKDQFEFLGLKKPKRTECMRLFIREHEWPKESEWKEVVKILWEQSEREFQYAALEMIEKRNRYWKETEVSFYETLITTKSWWDTVDHLSTRIVGAHFRRFPHLIVPYNEKWIKSDNIWLQRTAILFQLKYKEQTDVDLLMKNIEHCLSSKEFFIRKAIGWAMREYSKTNPEKILEMAEHLSLSPLSRREALKYIQG